MSEIIRIRVTRELLQQLDASVQTENSTGFGRVETRSSIIREACRRYLAGQPSSAVQRVAPALTESRP